MATVDWRRQISDTSFAWTMSGVKVDHPGTQNSQGSSPAVPGVGVLARHAFQMLLSLNRLGYRVWPMESTS